MASLKLNLALLSVLPPLTPKTPVIGPLPKPAAFTGYTGSQVEPNRLQQDQDSKTDFDDPFEPEAEVLTFAKTALTSRFQVDFLPSGDPLLLQHLSPLPYPSPSHPSHHHPFPSPSSSPSFFPTPRPSHSDQFGVQVQQLLGIEAGHQHLAEAGPSSKPPRTFKDSNKEEPVHFLDAPIRNVVERQFQIVPNF